MLLVSIRCFDAKEILESLRNDARSNSCPPDRPASSVGSLRLPSARRLPAGHEALKQGFGHCDSHLVVGHTWSHSDRCRVRVVTPGLGFGSKVCWRLLKGRIMAL